MCPFGREPTSESACSPTSRGLGGLQRGAGTRSLYTVCAIFCARSPTALSLEEVGQGRAAILPAFSPCPVTSGKRCITVVVSATYNGKTARATVQIVAFLYTLYGGPPSPVLTKYGGPPATALEKTSSRRAEMTVLPPERLQ